MPPSGPSRPVIGIIVAIDASQWLGRYCLSEVQRRHGVVTRPRDHSYNASSTSAHQNRHEPCVVNRAVSGFPAAAWSANRREARSNRGRSR